MLSSSWAKSLNQTRSRVSKMVIAALMSSSSKKSRIFSVHSKQNMILRLLWWWMGSNHPLFPMSLHLSKNHLQYGKKLANSLSPARLKIPWMFSKQFCGNMAADSISKRSSTPLPKWKTVPSSSPHFWLQHSLPSSSKMRWSRLPLERANFSAMRHSIKPLLISISILVRLALSTEMI